MSNDEETLKSLKASVDEQARLRNASVTESQRSLERFLEKNRVYREAFGGKQAPTLVGTRPQEISAPSHAEGKIVDELTGASINYIDEITQFSDEDFERMAKIRADWRVLKDGDPRISVTSNDEHVDFFHANDDVVDDSDDNDFVDAPYELDTSTDFVWPHDERHADDPAYGDVNLDTEILWMGFVVMDKSGKRVLFTSQSIPQTALQWHTGRYSDDPSAVDVDVSMHIVKPDVAEVSLVHLPLVPGGIFMPHGPKYLIGAMTRNNAPSSTAQTARKPTQQAKQKRVNAPKKRRK